MAARQNPSHSLPQRLWSLLTSRTLTAVLLAVLLLLLLASLFLPQMPVPGDPTADLNGWLAAARERYGERFDLYHELGLFKLPRTSLFLALAAALLLNALACTLGRVGPLWRAMARRPAVALPEEAYGSPDWQAAGIDFLSARRALRRPGWRLWAEAGPPDSFYSHTWRLAPLGSLLTHLGLFLLALAALLHTQLAWRERLQLDPGAPAATALRRQPECSVAWAGYRIHEGPGGRAWVEGRIRAAGGDAANEGWIGPAAPLAACGLRFYLASHGLALQVSAYTERGSRQEAVVPMDSGSEGSVGERPALIRYHAGDTAHSCKAMFSPSWYVTVTPTAATLAGLRLEPLAVRVEQQGQAAFVGPVSSDEYLELPGGKLLLHAERYLQVDAVYDPGAGPFLAGALLLASGSALGLLFPTRQLWARRGEDGTLQVRLGSGAEESQEQSQWLEQRLERVRRKQR